jgi:hypothetical protein
MSIRDPDNPYPIFDALHIPPAALEQGGTEVLRAIVIDGDLHVSLRRAFDEPDTWGVLLADVARHIASLYAREANLSEQEVIEKLCTNFQAELDEPREPRETKAGN